MMLLLLLLLVCDFHSMDAYGSIGADEGIATLARGALFPFERGLGVEERGIQRGPRFVGGGKAVPVRRFFGNDPSKKRDLEAMADIQALVMGSLDCSNFLWASSSFLMWTKGY